MNKRDYRFVNENTILVSEDDMKNFKSVLDSLDTFIDCVNGNFDADDPLYASKAGQPAIITLQFRSNSKLVNGKKINPEDLLYLKIPIIPAFAGDISNKNPNANKNIQQYIRFGTSRLTREDFEKRKEQLQPIINQNKEMYHSYVKNFILQQTERMKKLNTPKSKRSLDFLENLEFENENDGINFSRLEEGKSVDDKMMMIYNGIESYRKNAAMPLSEKDNTNSFTENPEKENRNNNVLMDNDLYNPYKEKNNENTEVTQFGN